MNVTKGVVTVNPKFFDRAFGKDVDEFFDLLNMPESYIMYRNHFEANGQTEKWRYQYKNLSAGERSMANEIIFTNNFSCNGTTPKAVLAVLEHYQSTYRLYVRSL